MILSTKITNSDSLSVSIAIAIGGSILIALFARIAIPVPFSPVPITGQTFAVLFLGGMLGSRLGLMSVSAYLLEGISGLPVFAGPAVGPLYLLGPTGGYLIGFIPAIYLVGYLAEKGLTIKLSTTFLTMIIGTIVIFFFGITWLSTTIGFEKALLLGFYPYLVGAGIKITLATLIVYSLNRFSD